MARVAVSAKILARPESPPTMAPMIESGSCASRVLRLLGCRVLACVLGLCGAAFGSGSLRVMSWNIHHGRGGDGVVDLPRIARVIREARPDVVLLQEVDCRCRRSGGVDQAAELARLTGMEGRFGRAMDFDGGQYGQAVLSRHPLRETRVHALPGPGEPRIGFEAVVMWDGSEVAVVSLHLDHLDEARRTAQARALVAALGPRAARPTVVCGDVNDLPGSAAVTTLAAAFPLVAKAPPVATHPADQPEIEIDHAFAAGLVGAVPVLVVGEPIASDHRPLLAVLARPTAPAKDGAGREARAGHRIEPGT